MFNQEKASPWVVFALKLAGEAVQRIGEMAPESGAEVVDRRDQTPGSYRHWDPETLRVDKEIEEFYIDQLSRSGIDAVVLSEEVGNFKVQPEGTACAGLQEPVYFVSDPFDGSLLYKRGIPAFWYSALSIFSRPGPGRSAEPLAAVVADCSARTMYFCDSAGSYEGRLSPGGGLVKIKENRPKTTDKLQEAFLETYLMKPHYMYPASLKFQFLFGGVKFILPNGGPSGFCDVASGKVDIYFAHKQPHTDIFPGLPVAQKAGCTVSTFEGRPVEFEARVENRYNIVCSANPTLHEQVLNLLKDNGITDRTGIQEG